MRNRRKELKDYFWNQYVDFGSYSIDSVPGRLIFDINSNDRRKFPELKGWREFWLWRDSRGRLYGKCVRAKP